MEEDDRCFALGNNQPRSFSLFLARGWIGNELRLAFLVLAGKTYVLQGLTGCGWRGRSWVGFEIRTGERDFDLYASAATRHTQGKRKHYHEHMSRRLGKRGRTGDKQ